jgi:hypothetical protein
MSKLKLNIVGYSHFYKIPHGQFKHLRGSFRKANFEVSIYLGLFERAKKHLIKHFTARSQEDFVASESLKQI